MKILIIILAMSFLPSLSYSYSNTNSTYVRGYTRSDGTRVKGHYRSKANNTRNDNWSTRGNTNPYTGKRGTSSRDSEYKYRNNYNSR